MAQGTKRLPVRHTEQHQIPNVMTWETKWHMTTREEQHRRKAEEPTLLRDGTVLGIAWNTASIPEPQKEVNFKRQNVNLVVGVHTFDPSALETEAGRSL